jgi:beta-glucosidase
MPERFPYMDPELSPTERTRDLLSRMTIEQKVGQMVQADGRHEAELQVAEQRVGSFLHILGDTTVELQKQASQTGLGIPLIFGIDAIHGHGFWPGATVFPTQLAISCSWNPDLVEEMGRVTAREMLCTGLHWTFSPVLCLTRDLRWGRVGETFGEDPYLLGVLGKAAVKGYQGDDIGAQDSVLACAKHYAGYSETVGGKDATEAEISERKLRTYFLPPFEDVARAGCRTFMTAYQCIDGVACAMNRWLLTEVLRDEWGFEGFVVTDWDNVGRSHKQQGLYSSIDAAVPDAVVAGNDMIMVTPEFYGACLAHLAQGTVKSEDVELAAKRILTQKFELGLFDHKRYPPLERIPEVVGCDDHRAALLPAALESAVLLKNAESGSGRPTLPFAPGLKKIAVLGPNADDTLAQLGDWSFGSGQAGLRTGGHPREAVVTVLDGLRERAKRDGVEVEYCRGARVLDSDLSEIDAAAQLAAGADVAVVVVGDTIEQIGEECDRSDLDLGLGQQSLLEAVKETGTPLVVVLVNSKPLCIPWVAEHADAVLETFNPGMRGGEAIAQLLFGDANPMGKLTVSFAKTLGQTPINYQQIPGWHGSKHGQYDSEPQFPFGFGLSYTRFEYSELELESSQVSSTDGVVASVTVRNVGDRAGTEITQLYLNDLFTKLSTPTKTLKRFARTTLKPGDSTRLRFELRTADLTYVGLGGEPVLEPGEFELMVGGSSQDDHLLTARFSVAD